MYLACVWKESGERTRSIAQKVLSPIPSDGHGYYLGLLSLDVQEYVLTKRLNISVML